MLKTTKGDSPLGLQTTGHEIKEFESLSKYIKEKTNFKLIDINCGCPSERIIGTHAGSYLLKSPEKIAQAIKILKAAGFTATAKIRLGFNKNNALAIAKSIEKAGADALTVHARLATDTYQVPADYAQIKMIKHNLGIPVIGNGDILSEEKAEAMLDITDGAMVARGAIGDPLIFNRILHYLRTGKKKEFNFKSNISAFQKYLLLAKKHDLIDIPRIKTLGSKFIKNIEGAGQLRNKLMQLKSYEDISKFIKELKT